MGGLLGCDRFQRIENYFCLTVISNKKRGKYNYELAYTLLTECIVAPDGWSSTDDVGVSDLEVVDATRRKYITQITT